MNILNTSSYKIIFYIENLLREYISEYMDETEFDPNKLELAKAMAEDNGVSALKSFEEHLEWLHLGELITCISSKWFRKVKNNSVNQINVSTLIKRRNDVMHSRNITNDNLDEMKNKCSELISALSSNEYTTKWNKFISDEINNIIVPEIHIEYPLGRNFKKLIGRDEELKYIKKELSIPLALSIVGIGGIGKTAVIQQLIEDLVFLPTRPFEKIYFMSFKNSVFENGKINRFQKVISNHHDLICKLAECMNIEEVDFKEKESKVWEEMFSSKSLLILDNLETEIVRSNLAEFTEIADKFMRNYTSNSRIIITSRFGLGDRERKYPLKKLDLIKTKSLVTDRVGEEKIRVSKVLDGDWDWIQKYGEGNPGLVIAFSDVLKNSNKSFKNLKIEYETNYSLEGKELSNIRDCFLDFCFENTIESLNENAQIYISIISDFCLQTGIYEFNNEIIQYICSDLKLDKRLGDDNIRTIMLENISFVQKKGLDEYSVNELQVAFLSKDESKNIFNIKKLKKLSWYSDIKKMILKITDMVYDKELSTQQLLARIYKFKYTESNDSKFLLDAFMCESSIENLTDYYTNIDSVYILNHFTLLEKCTSDLKNSKKVNEQQKLAIVILRALNKVRELIKDRKIKEIRQGDLIGYFNKLKDSMQIFDKNLLNVNHRVMICKFLNSIGREDYSEEYLEDSEEMYSMAFVVYSKKFGNLVGVDREACKKYMDKCEELKDKVRLTIAMKSRYHINLARYYEKEDPKLALTSATYLDEVSQTSDSIYSIYLESLLIRAKCLIQLNKSKEDIGVYVKKFEEEIEKPRYNNVYPSKKASLRTTYNFVKANITKKRKIVH